MPSCITNLFIVSKNDSIRLSFTFLIVKVGMDNIIVNRGKVVTLDSLPKYSIALDGFVQGPAVDPDNHRFSFDHHAKCFRYCTTAACMQAWTAVLLGLDDLDKYTIYCNDVDADVCSAVWCLKNPERCKEPLVKKLIDAIGLGDMHGGAFGYNGMTKVVEWICEPETGSKRHDDYHKISDEGLKSILEAVLYRIDLYVNGESSIEVSKQPKHGEYKILRNENDWVLVESSDPHAFSSIYQAGFTKIVLIRPQDDGSMAVTLAKKSDFVGGFPITKFYELLNKKELQGYETLNKTREKNNILDSLWGGGSTIGGAPRNHDGSRSHLSISTLINIIDEGVASEK
jgi:hypothetical protein